MERKNAVIAILALIAVVSIIGWISSHKKYVDLRSDDKELASYQDTLEVCEEITSLEDEAECSDKLADFSKLLGRYASKLKRIDLPGQTNQTATTTNR